MPLKCLFLLESSWFDNLGAEYLIATLRKNGYPVDVFFDESTSKAWKKPEKATGRGRQALLRHFTTHPADVIFFSVNTDYHQRAVSLSKIIKDEHPEAIICFGGPHATYAHEYVLKNNSVDFVCRGEGEVAIIELLKYMEHNRAELPDGIYRRLKDGKIEGSGFGRLAADVNSLPFPDKSDFHSRNPSGRRIYGLVSGRGCPNSCSYCNSPVMRSYYAGIGQRYCRRRSVDNVIAELLHAKREYKPGFVVFWDDSFLHDRNWLSEFSERYEAEIAIPFHCLANPNFTDEDVFGKLVRAGLVAVNCGIQSLNEDIRLRIFNRRESTQAISDFLQLMNRLGIYTQVDHIISPWDQREDLVRQARMYIGLRPSWINVFYLTWYPETAILRTAVGAGVLDARDREGVYDGILDRNYFMGGGISREKMSELADIARFLTMTPLLPRSVAGWLLDRNMIRVLKHAPWAMVLALRFINALFRKNDHIGREHIKNLFR